MSNKIIHHLAFKSYPESLSSSRPMQTQLGGDSTKTVHVLCSKSGKANFHDIPKDDIFPSIDDVKKIYVPNNSQDSMCGKSVENLCCGDIRTVSNFLNVVDNLSRKHIMKVKQIKKRVVTTHKNWNDIDKQTDTQYGLISNVHDINDTVQKELRKKIASYKSQDHQKNIFSDKLFIDFDFLIDLLQKSHLKCYYCKNSTLLIYDNVREPKQWTIERINNDFGHNRDNSVIACLDCNLKRRTVYHLKYLQTKQLTTIIQTPHTS